MMFIIAEPTPLVLDVMAMEVNSINVSWSQNTLATLNAKQTFSLTVAHGSSSKTIFVNESFYVFNAPPNAPPFEVYNFSVTATYVGATYTGDGCSVPSPVLSTMLPCLPDIQILESSLNFVLIKKSRTSEGINLTVFFLVSWLLSFACLCATKLLNDLVASKRL